MIGKWSGTALVLAPVMAALTVPALAHGTGDFGLGQGWGYGHMAGGWHYIFGPLMMVVGIALIAVLAVLLVRWLGGGARGEIDRADYLERKKDLS